MSMTTKDAERLVKRVLDQASFGDVRVHVASHTHGYSRFAQGAPTQCGDSTKVTVTVTAVKDGRHATASGSRTDDASIGALVKQAEELAALAPVDPEVMPPLGKMSPSAASHVDPEVSKMGAEQRAAQIEQAIASARSLRLDAAGFVDHFDLSEAMGDRAGLFVHQRRTQVSMSTTCRTSDGTGSSKAGVVGHALKAAGIDGGKLAHEAGGWALQSRAPVAVPPGRYTVVLSPNAVAEMLLFFVQALSHRAAVEGRSFFSAPEGKTRVGEVLFDSKIHIWSDPDDHHHPASKFTSEGVVQPKVDWVKNGRVEALTAGRYWSQHAGVPLLPAPSSLHMAGDQGDLDSLIAGVDRGILVTRFWYNRLLEPETILATGLTRDGTFLIEKGKLSHSIKNFRYNESPVTLLKNVAALGKPRRAGLLPEGVWVVPPMVVRDFNFESSSDAV